MSTEVTKPIILDETGKGIKASLDLIARALSGDKDAGIAHHSMTQAIVRAGMTKSFFARGDLYKVDKESGVSITVHATGVTAATVTEDTFIAAVGTSHTHGYEFIYDGAVWHMEGEEIELQEYGIAITGTPAANDILVVHVQADVIYFEVLDTDDFDVPINPALEHTLPLLSRDILSYGTIPFCPAQLMKAVDATEFANGIAPGTCYFIADHAAYNNGTGQDGSYNFTPTVTIPVGGGVRHTVLGVYRSDGTYTKAQVLAGTFTTYDASGNVLESGLATSEGATGTYLGTVTAEDPTYMSGTNLNSTRRQGQGSNEAANGYMRMWLRSSAAGAASGQVASWYQKISKFDLPIKSTLPGFLHGIDPEFAAVICPVRKRTFLHPFDRTGADTYIDTEETVWQISMTEMGFGANSNVQEVGVKADGTVKRSGAYALYNGASDADRIKYQGTTARYWFLRSPNPSNANHVRSVIPSGTLGNNNASNPNGVVAGLCIG